MFESCIYIFSLSSEVDEIYKICGIIGTPSRSTWAEGLQLADAIKFQFPQVFYPFITHTAPKYYAFFTPTEIYFVYTLFCSWKIALNVVDSWIDHLHLPFDFILRAQK